MLKRILYNFALLVAGTLILFTGMTLGLRSKQQNPTHVSLALSEWACTHVYAKRDGVVVCDQYTMK